MLMPSPVPQTSTPRSPFPAATASAAPEEPVKAEPLPEPEPEIEYDSFHQNYMRAADGFFRPDKPLTRAECAQLLCNLTAGPENTEAELPPCPYGDVAPEAWYYEAVCRAAAYFSPDEDLFRPEEAAKLTEFIDALCAALQFPDDEAPEALTAACNEIAAASTPEELPAEQPDELSEDPPQPTLTRAEAAVLLNRALGRLPDAEAAESCPASLLLDVPEEPTVDTPEDGVHLQDGTAYDYQNGAPVTGSGLTELDGAWYVFQPDGSLFPFVHGLNDCNGILYYHTGEDGFALNTPDAGLYDDGEALYFVQDDRSLLQNGNEGYLTFGADGRYTSGSAELDEGIWQLLQDSTPDTGADSAARLEAVFDYIRDNFKYLSMAHYDVGTTDWAQEAAEAFLQQRKGNCYCFAATFMYCARRLGYQAMSSQGMNRARTTTVPGR